jgi:hypothetical protein
VVARDGTPMGELPEADLLHSSNLLKSAGRGGITGGAVGLLAGLLAMTIPPAGIIIGGGAVAGITIAGSGFGAWTASMIGISGPNSQVEAFEDAIKAGEILIMVDAPKERGAELEDMIRRHYPEVQINDTDAHTPTASS